MKQSHFEFTDKILTLTKEERIDFIATLWSETILCAECPFYKKCNLMFASGSVLRCCDTVKYFLTEWSETH